MKDELIDRLNQKMEKRRRLRMIPGFSLTAFNSWATFMPSNIRKWSTRLMQA